MNLQEARAAAALARETGAPTYAGMICQACQGQTRYTSNRQCVDCAKAQRKAAHKANPKASAVQKSAWRARQPDPIAAILASVIDEIPTKPAARTLVDLGNSST